MSGIAIRSGRVVEVDSASLREVSRTIADVAADLEGLDAAVRLAIDAVPPSGVAALGAASELAGMRAQAAAAADEGRDLARRLDAAAHLYEAVELLAERVLARAEGDAERLSRIDESLARLSAEEPSVLDRARRALEAPPAHGDLVRQSYLTAHLLGPAAAAAFPFVAPAVLGSIEALGRGRVGASARLSGTPARVSTPLLAAAPARPPTTLAAAAQRIPSGDARVRVERYAMPDGTRQFALYVGGTRSVAIGGRDPFDAESNVRLYSGERSASYDATVSALEHAGAGPGDVVHAFGHSQGAMIAERIALEGDYDVRTLVSFGGPVHADVGDGTLSVSIRHTDDPVAALQSGGHAAGVGAPGSFAVEREAHRAVGPADLGLPAHAMSAYAETAAMVDASSDPRVAALRTAFAGLARAESAEGLDFGASRLSPGGGGGG